MNFRCLERQSVVEVFSKHFFPLIYQTKDLDDMVITFTLGI